MTTKPRVIMAVLLSVTSLATRRLAADSGCSPGYGGSGPWWCAWANSEMSCTSWFLYCDGACASELSGWGCDPGNNTGFCTCS